jgi:hypothetical protein
MKRSLGTACVAFLISGASLALGVDDKEAMAILDRAMKALGGEERLSKATTVSWRSTGMVKGNRNPVRSTITLQGLDHSRLEFQAKFGDNEIKGVNVLAGDKGWRRVGDMAREMDAAEIATEKRMVFLQLIPATLYPLKREGFKTELAGEEEVGDKPASVMKVTGPDGRSVKLYFDKESGLPVRLVATLIGPQGEFTQETNYSNYKDFGGIRQATRVETKADGEKFADVEVTEFKVLDNVPPETFTQPK